MKKKLSALVACLTLVVLASSSAMGGILLTPSDAIDQGVQTAKGSPNSVNPNQINGYLNLNYDLLATREIYKSDVVDEGFGSDSGDAGDLYDTFYSNDAKDAVITWNGGLTIIDATHLLVKGGQQIGWLLFEIGDWNGQHSITLKGFSPSISHISIYGQLSAVPEPTSIGLFLLGMGCVTGGSFIRRRRA